MNLLGEGLVHNSPPLTGTTLFGSRVVKEEKNLEVSATPLDLVAHRGIESNTNISDKDFQVQGVLHGPTF
jgi:hypothetical protein